MSTQMSTGPEPAPIGFTPCATPLAGCAVHDGYHPVGQCTTEDPIRLAVRAALTNHAPAGKEYGPNGEITKICRCGLRTEAATLVPRTQHLEDVVVAALHTTPELVARVAAVVEARRGEAAPLPTRDEVLRVAEVPITWALAGAAESRKSVSPTELASDLINTLHEAGMLAWREASA